MFNRHASRQSPRPSVIKNSGLLCPASSSASQSCQPQPVDRVKKGQPLATQQICRLRSIMVGRTMETSLGQFLDRFLDSDCHQDSGKFARSEWTDVLGDSSRNATVYSSFYHLLIFGHLDRFKVVESWTIVYNAQPDEASQFVKYSTETVCLLLPTAIFQVENTTLTFQYNANKTLA